jgi:hypothetical protein
VGSLKIIKKLLVLILVIVVMAGLFLISKVHITSTDSTYQDKAAWSKGNIIIESPIEPAKINPIVAIASAVKTYHTQIFLIDKINVEYQLMTGTAGGHTLTKESVYIVSFWTNKGNSVPAGPIGNEKVFTHHEFNVVVDANNGETLFALEYR